MLGKAELVILGKAMSVIFGNAGRVILGSEGLLILGKEGWVGAAEESDERGGSFPAVGRRMTSTWTGFCSPR